ncbi:MAG: viperin family antiviral radical SAM protein [Thermoplasmata archaeon]|nr:viperin family antiviral radical SAM protein [Thermoplasmata archaeon]
MRTLISFSLAQRKPLKAKSKLPPAANWHITKACNFNCIYCFAGFKSIQETLPKKVALQIPRQLKELGVEKLNIAGGEPLLYPYLMEILEEAKHCGLVVTLISNGALLNEDNLEAFHDYVDWIGISIDSCNEYVQHRLGRGAYNQISNSIQKAKLIKEYDFKLKINTVVTKLNMHEDMRPLIKSVDPERWKVFQVMERKGENDHCIAPLLITKEEFVIYTQKNDMVLDNGSTPRFESNEVMRQSYLMLDPLGRFFHSAAGPIEIIPTNPLNLSASKQDIVFDYETFKRRGGIYDWSQKITKQKPLKVCGGVI